MKKFILALLLLSGLFWANQNPPPDLSSYCFLPMAQITMSGQLNYGALNASNATTVSSDGYLYIKDVASDDYISIYADKGKLFLQFSSDNVSVINSRLEYINSLNIFLIENAEVANPKVEAIKSAECRPISPPTKDDVVGTPEQTKIPLSDEERAMVHVQPKQSSAKSVAPSENTNTKDTNSLSLEQMLIPLVLGVVSTLFLIIVIVHFRGNLFKPIDHPDELTIGKTQFEIMEEISDVQKIPTDIANRVGKSKSTVIEHLEYLQKMGLVEKVSEPGHKFVYYRLTHSGKTLFLKKRSAA